jgi:nucleoside-diphosphate-sugar epimerase
VTAPTDKKTVVVLGGSGFIGRRIVAALASTNWARPIATSRRIASIDLGIGVEKIAVEATDPRSLENLLSGAAGVVSSIAGTAGEIRASGTALLTAASRLRNPPRIIYLSSMAAYGSSQGRADESAPLRGDLGDYSAAKAAIDTLAAQHSFVVRLRPGIVYGPGSAWWSDRIARLLVARRLGNLGPAGQGTCNLVYVDDVAAATVRALESPDAGGEAFNLGSAQAPTWNEYFALYAQALGVTPVRQVSRAQLALELYLSGPLLKIMEKAWPRSPLLQANPAIRPWLTKLCRHGLHIEVSKAEQRLGMQWTPLQQGLALTARWFLQGGRT